MKLKSRLVIAFCVVILLPILLFSMSVCGLGLLKAHSIEESYGVHFSLEQFADSAQILSQSTAKVYERLLEKSKEDPDSFLNFSNLQDINDEISDTHSYLLLIKDGELFYSGTRDSVDDLIGELPDPEESQMAGDSGTYIGNDIRAFVKRIHLDFSDGSNGMLYLVTSADGLLPQIRSYIIEMIICIIIILIITGGAMSLWIYRGIMPPIRNLREATKRISEGDLDFTIESDEKNEFGDLCRDFESMRKKLKESLDEKELYDRENKELISNISHDLKTPITTVKGYVEGIMDGVADTPEKMDRYIKTIYNKANDMDRLINELTFYSKIDTNRIHYNFNRINVAAYFEDCAEEVCLDLEERGYRFTYINQVKKDTQIIADPEQMKRVIDNIIGNSIKYMDKNYGSIELRILDAGDFVQVELEDNGKGIDAKDLPNIFDRFYRTDASRNSEKGGSGIGLSIVKKIVEDHGGKIWASSKPGRGTTMHFVIRKYQEVPV